MKIIARKGQVIHNLTIFQKGRISGKDRVPFCIYGPDCGTEWERVDKWGNFQVRFKDR